MENCNNHICEICVVLSSFKINKIYKNFFFYSPISYTCLSNEMSGHMCIGGNVQMLSKEANAVFFFISLIQN